MPTKTIRRLALSVLLLLFTCVLESDGWMGIAGASSPLFQQVQSFSIGTSPQTNDRSSSRIQDLLNAEVRLSATRFEVTEGYTARAGVLSNLSQMGVSAIVSTTDGTAVGGATCSPGVDYIHTDRRLLFYGFDYYQEAHIATCPDTEFEGDETIKVTLSPGSGTTVVPPAEAILTIHARSPTPSPSPTPTPSQTPSCNLSYSYVNNSPLVIYDFEENSSAGPAPALGNNYPAKITVPDARVITGISVKLSGFDHTRPDDLDIMLVGPGGENAIIMSDAGGSEPVAGIDITLDEGAFSPLPDNEGLSHGVFRPANFGPDDTFRNAPAPTGVSSLSAFYGALTDGDWYLFAVDDSGDQVGSIVGGWEITFHVACPTITPTPSPTASPSPSPESCSPTGVLDPSFDGDGKLTASVLNSFNEAYAIAVQADGKIVAAGKSNDRWHNYFSVARFNEDGTLDPSFAGDGTAATSGVEARAVAIQPDGKIVVAGFAFSEPINQYVFALVRYHANGLRDTSFDGDGKVTTPVQEGSYGRALALQPDGKILIAGSSVHNDLHAFTVARYNSDGTLDAAFDNDGIVTTAVTSISIANTIAIQPDGKIVAAGSAHINSTSGTDFAVARYNTDGGLDTSFDGDGKVTTPILSHSDDGNSVAVQPDGKIVLAGSTSNTTGRDVAVVRYRPDGSLDASFSNDGKVTTPIFTSDDGNSVALLADGRILVGGSTYSGSKYVFALVRYNPDGRLDNTLDSDGKLTTSISEGNNFANAMAVQADGRIVLAGLADGLNYGERSYFALARYGSPCSVGGSAPFDYDGDGKTDVSVYRPDGGLWFINNSGGSGLALQLGTNTDRIAPADYDGDSRTDLAVFRPNNGSWYRYNSATATYSAEQFGLNGDLPAPGDYDGDGKADVAIYRPSTGTWWLNRSTEGLIAIQFGLTGDIPVPGDFDGDGKADLVVYRPSNGIWYMQQSTAGGYAIQFGNATDKLAPADYDGDGKMDVGIYRPSQGTWYSYNSSNGAYPVTVFGLETDIPTPGDYDGDGKADIAIFRPSNGQWWLNRTTSGLTVVQFGQNGDVPTMSAFSQ